MQSLRSSSRGSQPRLTSTGGTKGFRCNLSHKQLVWLCAMVLVTGLITVPPSLATLNSLSSSGAGQPDSFPSPTGLHNAVVPAAAAAATSTNGGPTQQQQQQQQTADNARAVHTASKAVGSAGQTQIQQQQQTLTQQHVPVDVVYLYVNGSDPELAEELQRFRPRSAAAAAAASKPAASKPAAAGAGAGKAKAPAGASAAAAVVVRKAAARHLMSVTADSSSTAAQGRPQQQQQQQHKTSGQAPSQADPAVAGDHSAAQAPAKPAAQQTQQAVKQAATSPAKPPTQQSQGQQQQPKQSAAKPGPAAAAAKPRLLPLTELPTREARFDAGRDELRYSLRSLEMHLPWYRHLYIVTNGQVPSWLDLSNPRVTLVPHTSIFKNASHLPSFNSNAIQANLVNIPGLSPHFIMMDDDLLLTQPWSHEDFIGPDGGQITTGSALATQMSGTLPMYMRSIQRLVAVFQERFGSWPRYLPAHAPHFLEVPWLRRMWEELPREFEATSAAQLRTDKDVVIAAAYQWFISQFQQGRHPTAPDGRSTFFSLGNYLAKCFETAAINDIRVNPAWREFKARVSRTKATTLAVNAEATVGIAAALEGAAAGRRPRQYLVKMRSNMTAQLTRVFDQPGVKMVCLNDDIDDLYAAVRPLINPAVVDFLSARYPTPSQYELPPGRVNDCRRVKPKGFGHLPTAADLAAACGTQGAASKTASAAAVGLSRQQQHRKHGPQLTTS